MEGKKLSYLFRHLYRTFYVNGKPSHQLLVGIVLIPLGLIVTFFALFGSEDYTYPIYAIFGIAFAIFGIFLIVKGARGLTASKSRTPKQQNVAPHPSQVYGQGQQPIYPPQAYGQGQPPVYPPQTYGQGQSPVYPPQGQPPVYPPQAYGQGQQFYEQPSYGQTPNAQD
jgi:hypothetical protein